MNKNVPQKKSNSIDKVIDVIECLYRHGGKAKIQTISADLNMYKSTVHRILNTLKERGYIYQDSIDASYGIGSRFFVIGELFKQQFSFVDILKPYTEELSQRYNENIQITIIDSVSTDVPRQISIHRSNNSNNVLSIAPPIGSTSDSHCSASGKCLLAFSPSSHLEQFMGCKLPKYTEHTIVDWDCLLHELEIVRKQGWATDVDELEEGLSCIAVPIFDGTHHIIATVSILGSSSRILKLDRDALLADLQSVAARIR